jgi:hypothetical protein
VLIFLVRRIAQTLRTPTYVLAIGTTFALASSGTLALENGDETVHRVLIVYQDSSTFTSAIEIAQGLGHGLKNLPNTNLEVYTEFLDIVRFSAPDHIRRLADNLAAKYQKVPLNVVVTVGPEALQFMLNYRSRIASMASVVFGDMSERSLKRLSPPDDMKGVITAYDVSKTIDLAARLQPDAKRIVVVSGSAEFDRYWRESAHQKLGIARGTNAMLVSAFALDRSKSPPDFLGMNSSNPIFIRTIPPAMRTMLSGTPNSRRMNAPKMNKKKQSSSE